jgi:hypothetical protein
LKIAKKVHFTIDIPEEEIVTFLDRLLWSNGGAEETPPK